MSSSLSQLSIAQQILTRYGMTTYLVFGNIGFFFIAIFFSQPGYRRNSCSLYLLSGLIFKFIALNIGVIPIIYALDNPDPRSTSLIFCKLQYYLRHTPNQIMRSFIILACIDRYASCSMKPRIRSFNQFHVAIRVIPITVILWLAITSYIPALHAIQSGRCGMFDSVYVLIYTIYNVITTGILPPFAMTLFGLLVAINLRRVRSRVQPTTVQSNTHNVTRKRDRDLAVMTLVETAIYMITTTPYSIMVIYLTATKSISKSIEQQQIESFISYFAQSFLLYLNNALPFWIYILTSHSFRLECKRMFISPCTTMVRRCIPTA